MTLLTADYELFLSEYIENLTQVSFDIKYIYMRIFVTFIRVLIYFISKDNEGEILFITQYHSEHIHGENENFMICFCVVKKLAAM